MTRCGAIFSCMLMLKFASSVFVIKALLLFLLLCANSACCSVCADMKLHFLSSVCTQAWRMVTAGVAKLLIALFTHQKTIPGTGKGCARCWWSRTEALLSSGFEENICLFHGGRIENRRNLAGTEFQGSYDILPARR